MEPFPVLYTSRLTLRKLEIGDVEALVKHANNPKISDEIVNLPYPYREPDAVFRIGYVYHGYKNKLRYVFAIIHRDRNELIGEVSLHMDRPGVAQLGYWVGEPFWDHGFATEAVERVLDFGFQNLKLQQIFATCGEHNEASTKVLMKVEMVKESRNGKVGLFSVSAPEIRGK